MVPFRPGYQTALWVLRHEEAPEWQGRVLLADVSDRPLTDRVADELILDVATWRREGHRPEQHLRAYASQVRIADLIVPRRPLTARRPATLREMVRDGRRTVAELAELEVDLNRLAGPRPQVRTLLAAQDDIQRAPTRSIGALVRDGHLVLLNGSRIADADVSGDGHYPVVGPPELAGATQVGSRRIDRAVFAQRYPRARLTEAGDLLVTMTPWLRAYHDAAGTSVVDYPTRVLRILPDGGERFTRECWRPCSTPYPRSGRPARCAPRPGWPTCNFPCFRPLTWRGSTRCWRPWRSAVTWRAVSLPCSTRSVGGRWMAHRWHPDHHAGPAAGWTTPG